MEKKRVFSKSLILLAITSIMLFAMSITSMAATETNMNIQQTGSSSSRVDITWQNIPWSEYSLSCGNEL